MYDNNGKKVISTYSGVNDVMLSIYIDEQDIFRLQFDPTRKIKIAKFDNRLYREMNFDSLYGYDHWIRKMKKRYRLQVWFEGESRYEEFSLKGFGKAVNWLYKE